MPRSITVDSSFLKSDITFIPDLLPEINNEVFETVFSEFKELGVWLSAKRKYTVELLIDKEIGTYVLERKMHSDQKITENPDGSVKVEFETTQLPEIKRWVLGQGKTVKVLNPPELVQEILSEVESIKKIYEGEK